MLGCRSANISKLKRRSQRSSGDGICHGDDACNMSYFCSAPLHCKARTGLFSTLTIPPPPATCRQLRIFSGYKQAFLWHNCGLISGRQRPGKAFEGPCIPASFVSIMIGPKNRSRRGVKMLDYRTHAQPPRPFTGYTYPLRKHGAGTDTCDPICKHYVLSLVTLSPSIPCALHGACRRVILPE